MRIDKCSIKRDITDLSKFYAYIDIDNVEIKSKSYKNIENAKNRCDKFNDTFFDLMNKRAIRFFKLFSGVKITKNETITCKYLAEPSVFKIGIYNKIKNKYREFIIPIVSYDFGVRSVLKVRGNSFKYKWLINGQSSKGTIQMYFNPNVTKLKNFS